MTKLNTSKTPSKSHTQAHIDDKLYVWCRDLALGHKKLLFEPSETEVYLEFTDNFYALKYQGETILSFTSIEWVENFADNYEYYLKPASNL